MMRKLLFTLALLAAAVPLRAARSVEREVACPICGRDFFAILDFPDNDYEMRLDMKPLGAIPGPFHVPDCPGCGFVIFTLGMKKPELAKCKAFVESDEFKKGGARSSYYRLGTIYRHLGNPDFDLAQCFLKASWQEERDPAKLKEDQELALKHFGACAKSCDGAEQENSQLMMAELLRRLGRFEEAKAHIAGLRGLKGFQGNFYTDVLDLQVSLCGRKDPSIHDMEEVKVAKLPLVSRLAWKARKSLSSLKKSLGLK